MGSLQFHMSSQADFLQAFFPTPYVNKSRFPCSCFETTFLAPHHSWITGLRIVFFHQSQPSLLELDRLLLWLVNSVTLLFNMVDVSHWHKNLFGTTFQPSLVIAHKCDSRDLGSASLKMVAGLPLNRVNCIKRGYDVIDKRYKPVIQS